MPPSVKGQDTASAARAVPSAIQFTADPVSVPRAVPASLTFPAHVALKVPLALAPVCSATFHLKSLQLAAEGRPAAAEVQVPTSGLAPDGPVTVLFRSNPRHPAAKSAAQQTPSSAIFFMASLLYGYRARADAARRTFAGETAIIPERHACFNKQMSILKVARMGHPVLRAKARALEPAEIRSAPIQQLIDDMFETMREYQGVGLAAPQVHESVRLFVAGFAPSKEEDAADPGDRVPEIVLINPEISVEGEETVEDWEGCLSIPDIRGRVPRARRIVVRAYDRRARRIELRAANFTARVIQHETDHLDGVLFFDRMRSFETLAFLDEFGRYWAD